jgi:zinc protease
MFKESRHFLFVLFAVCLSGLALPAQALDDPALRTKITKLENGLTVLLLEDHSTPVVSFQMWVRAGSRDEHRYTGIAHLFEHMMFKGSKHIGPEEHARRIEAHGGRVNAYTSRDRTVYHEDIPAEALPLVIALEAERVAHLDINQATLDSERQVVLEERRMRTEDNPQGLAFEALLATRFVAHPYRWPVIGWRSDVEQVTLEACQEFFDHYYAPNNLVLVIVGDFESEDVLADIRREFGKLKPSAEIPRNPTVEPEQNGERRTQVYFDLESPIFAAAWHAPASGHPDSTTLDVIGEALSAGRSSRLYRRLVYEEQQALSASGGYWEMNDDGLFYAFAGVRPDGSVDRVEELFFDEVRKLREELLSPAELGKAKRQIEVMLVMGQEMNHAIAARIGRDFTTLGRIRPLEERLAILEAVSAEDVQRVAQHYLSEKNRSVVRVIPRPPPAPGASAPVDEATGGEAR